MSLRIESISKRFGGIQALNEINLTLPLPGFYGFIGPNGSGKTVLFDILGGYSRQDTGSILLDGINISNWPAFRRGALQLGFVRTFQEPRIYPRLSVVENAISGAAFEKGTSIAAALFDRRTRDELIHAKNKASVLLSAFHLSEMAEKTAVSLSFGQKKRLELVRALMTPAKLFFLDEPFAGLDSHSLSYLPELLTSLLRQRGATLLIIDHRQIIVQQLVDRVFTFKDGRIH